MWTGGITQIRAAKSALLTVRSSETSFGIFGMVKNDKHRTKALIDEEKREVPLSENAMNLLTQFQDTVHDTAIEYHRKLRDKAMTKSQLDEIEGIGEKKKELLLKTFGSIDSIKEADIIELMKIKGINEDLARRIKESLE